MAGRKGRETFLDGGPNSKFKLNNLKSGQGPAVMHIDQTVINLPQEEVDLYANQIRELLRRYYIISLLKTDDLIKDKKQRAYLKLGDLNGSMMSAQQLLQALAGHTSRSLDIPVDAVMEELGRVRESRRELGKAIDELVEQVEARRALPAPVQLIEIPADADVIDVVPEPVETRPQEVPVHRVRIEWCQRMGYLDSWGKPTEKAVTETLTGQGLPPWLPRLMEAKLAQYGPPGKGEGGHQVEAGDEAGTPQLPSAGNPAGEADAPEAGDGGGGEAQREDGGGEAP